MRCTSKARNRDMIAFLVGAAMVIAAVLLAAMICLAAHDENDDD